MAQNDWQVSLGGQTAISDSSGNPSDHIRPVLSPFGAPLPRGQLGKGFALKHAPIALSQIRVYLKTLAGKAEPATFHGPRHRAGEQRER